MSSAPTDEATATPTVQPIATFPFAVTCGPMQPARCRSFVAGVAAGAIEQYAGKTISSIRVASELGSYTLIFTDGTGVAAVVN